MNLGIKDEAFVRGKVPMTKEEIRILTLVKAQIAPDAVVYDIGAGTGSLSIEAARLAPAGHVYAIEKNPEGIGLIAENAKKFSVENITVVEGAAPDALAGLPTLDVALIGGSGRRLADILDIIGERLRPNGRIVANAITIQTVAACLDYFHAHADLYTYEAIQVQISRLERVGPYDMAKALNPIYIITAQRK
ncbi:precorrin-6Y C5,15-methyltransferase (decarboxylating) subunit CbiT [Selenomonas sp. oral taxon 126]|uniref:precorrin-6Y C5,15-methyltransferase (decarboxylating) subunit CbiT n=1 Tax=Selenomonas sp. oral taxon 126 TaxID=712528 RepID=UPI0008079E7E|nr:precorrin-6Y C5,15-methyltransferase (decarboxylating) subunit CbiT [Selenomonas sp. oral taxon 126]ANR71552.1 precorrin-6Y C5,15-methyltransferase (decarboxylating) subunit CbiT [Selenomonas sp. oral taxon 126]